MNFKALFTYDYLFAVNPGVSRGDEIYLALGALFLLLAAAIKISAVFAPSPVDKKYRNKLFAPAVFLALWLGAWYGLRWENVRFFGSHFMAWLGAAAGLIWLGFAAVKMLRHYRGEKQEWEKAQVKMKYLPK